MFDLFLNLGEIIDWTIRAVTVEVEWKNVEIEFLSPSPGETPNQPREARIKRLENLTDQLKT